MTESAQTILKGVDWYTTKYIDLVSVLETLEAAADHAEKHDHVKIREDLAMYIVETHRRINAHYAKYDEIRAPRISKTYFPKPPHSTTA